MMELGFFHYDSLWAIEPTSTFEDCFTGGRDGQIYHTSLLDDQHTLLYTAPKKSSPILSLTYDEYNQQLWFTSANDSSLRCLDLQKRNINQMRRQALDDVIEEEVIGQTPHQNNNFTMNQSDYEL